MLVLSLISLLSLVYSVASECFDKCNNRGTCRGGVCDCIQGFYDDESTSISDCTIGINDKYGTEWATLRYTFLVFYAAIAIISGLGVKYSPVDTRKAGLVAITASNFRRIVLGLTSLASLSHIIYLGWDPKFQGHIATEWLLWGLVFPISFSAFVSILFHWIDLYNVSVDALRKEEMLQKINTKYQGKQITLEEMISKVKIITKLGLPFIIIAALMYIIFFLTVALLYIQGRTIMTTLYFVYLIMNWIILCTGFLFYGRKIVNIMPPVLFKKVRKVTRRLTWVSIICLISMISNLVANIVLNSMVGGPLIYIVQFVVIEILLLMVLITLIVMFVRPNKNFPFCFRTSSHSSNSTKEGSVPLTEVSRTPSLETLQNSNNNYI